MNDAPQLQEVYRGTRKDCFQRGLALEAAGIAYAVHESPAECRIVVRVHDAATATAEMEAYASENSATPVAPTEYTFRGSGWFGVLGYTAILVLVYLLRENRMGGDWLGEGRLQGDLIRRGEFWRAVTALTLHVQPAHLVGNIVFGGLIGLFAGQLLGSGLAWLSILLAGSVGNLLSTSFRPDAYSAIGASTSVFAALGILAAYQWARWNRPDASMLARFAPLIGGVILLSYLGSGGERTDVISHLCGFLVGLLVGVVFAKLERRIKFKKATQMFLGLLAVVLLASAWIFALASPN